uniref:Calcium-transporting ATPase (EC) n=1 Tax=Ganoderma boninense TaxID=34458 RepID=A0A5K1JT83_9APHY|nr:Calcium-transporting ATPase (EC [Ganoderma boninense]
MALERKRAGEGSSSSGRAAYGANPRAAPVYAQYRSESPPASAYFSHFAGQDHELQPTTPDAQAHFAYSTTLRRHTLEGPLGIPSTPLRSSLPSIGELKNAMEVEGVRGVWERTVGRLFAALSGHRDQHEFLPTHRAEVKKESASARFAHSSIEVRRIYGFRPCRPSLTFAQETILHFGTSATHGLPLRRVQELLQTHGYNEFSVDAPEPLLVKFAKTIYENPLILLLCGSAGVSAVMGNIDDAISITVAVFIVLTGELPYLLWSRLREGRKGAFGNSNEVLT